MTDFEWLDSGPNCSEGHYSMHSKNPHLSPSLYTTAVHRISSTDSKVRTALHVHVSIIDSESERVK